MSVLSFAQILRSYFLFLTVGSTFICDEGEWPISLICSVLDEVWHEYQLILFMHVLTTSCQVYPSEYAYRGDSVNRAESRSANCRSYPVMDGLPADIYS